MAQIGVKHNFPSITNKIILVWYESSSPLAEVGRHVFDPPHDHVTYAITGINPVVHIVKWYESSDGSTLETLLDLWSIDAALFNQISVELFHYRVDRGYTNTSPVNTGPEVWADPADGDDTINDERLDGATYADTQVNMRSIGPRAEDEFEFVTGGGIRLTRVIDTLPEKFIAADDIFITRHFIITQQLPDPPSGDYQDIKIISANADFDNTFYKKECIANGASGILTVTFPAFSLIPNTKVRFATFGGSQRYLKLQFNTGDEVAFQGVNRNVIYLGKNEKIELLWKDNVCYVLAYEGNYADVADYIYSNNKEKANCLLCDGVEYNLADYPRLIAEIPSELTCTYTEYDQTQAVTVGNQSLTYYKNRGKVAINNGTGKFKVPDLRNWSFRGLKYFDGTTDSSRLTQNAGSVQAQEIAKHFHESGTETDGGSGHNRSALHTVRWWNVGHTDGARTSSTNEMGGNENRVDNIGQYVLIRY